MLNPEVPTERPVSRKSGTDPHGRAALLLTESLLHGLLAHEVLSSAAVLEIVQTAIDVQIEVNIDRGEDVESSIESGLLDRMRSSLCIDQDS